MATARSVNDSGGSAGSRRPTRTMRRLSRSITILVSCDATPWAKEQLKFPAVEDVTNFRQEDPNTVADSLLVQYLADTSGVDTLLFRRNLSKIGPKKKNIYLLNPEVNGATALDNFFTALQYEKDTAVIRIAHYGDSQLEGDRMSWVMREEFHEKFGGSGVGYVPLKDLSPVSYSRTSSGNWARYTVFHDKYTNNFYGMSGLVFHFSRHSVFQEGDDSISNSSVIDTSATKISSYSSASVSVKLRSAFGKYFLFPSS